MNPYKPPGPKNKIQLSKAAGGIAVVGQKSAEYIAGCI
jgi:hypothetical protein